MPQQRVAPPMACRKRGVTVIQGSKEMTTNGIITVLLVLLVGILVRDRLRGTAERARAGLGSTISGFDPAETTMSNDNMFEEQDPTVLGSPAWMMADADPANVGSTAWRMADSDPTNVGSTAWQLADADPTNIGSTAWQIADADPTNVGASAWLDEQVLHDHSHGHDDWMPHHHNHNSDW